MSLRLTSVKLVGDKYTATYRMEIPEFLVRDVPVLNGRGWLGKRGYDALIMGWHGFAVVHHKSGRWDQIDLVKKKSISTVSEKYVKDLLKEKASELGFDIGVHVDEQTRVTIKEA